MKKTTCFKAAPYKRRWLKTILLMKLTAFLILAAALQVSANTFSQERVTVNFDNVRLDKALKEVEQKSDYRFVFSNRLLSDKMIVSLQANAIMVEDLLKQMLNNTGLTYDLMENKLVVIKKGS